MNASLWEKQMQVVVDAFHAEFSRAVVNLDPVGSFDAVVVSSTTQKQLGMIGKTFEDMQAEAMLFLEPAPVLTAFHNEGVHYPLVVALFDANGVLIDQFRLEANDSSHHRPRAPYVYAVELPVSDAFPFPSDLRLRVSSGRDPVSQEVAPQG